MKLALFVAFVIFAADLAADAVLRLTRRFSPRHMTKDGMELCAGPFHWPTWSIQLALCVWWAYELLAAEPPP